MISFADKPPNFRCAHPVEMLFIVKILRNIDESSMLKLKACSNECGQEGGIVAS